MTTKLGIEAVDVAVDPVAAITIEAQCQIGEIGATVGALFARLGEFMTRNGLRATGAPRIIYRGMDAGDTLFILAFPVAADVGADIDEGDIRLDRLPGGRMWRFAHHGPYPNLGVTYQAITEWLLQRKLIDSEDDWSNFMPMWEEYVSDPATTKPDDLLTYIYLPADGEIHGDENP
jgi:effector-binding domain-containing protein